MNWLFKKKKSQSEVMPEVLDECAQEPEPEIDPNCLTREELRVCAYLQRVMDTKLGFFKEQGLCRCAKLAFTEHSLWMNNREICFEEPFDLHPYVSELAAYLEKSEKEDCTYLSKEEVHELLDEAIKVMKKRGHA